MKNAVTVVILMVALNVSADDIPSADEYCKAQGSQARRVVAYQNKGATKEQIIASFSKALTDGGMPKDFIDSQVAGISTAFNMGKAGHTPEAVGKVFTDRCLNKIAKEREGST